MHCSKTIQTAVTSVEDHTPKAIQLLPKTPPLRIPSAPLFSALSFRKVTNLFTSLLCKDDLVRKQLQ